MYEDVTKQLRALMERLDHAEVYLELPRHREEAARLEELTGREGFWNDQKGAQTQLKQLKLHRVAFEPWDKLRKETKDAIEMAELMAAENEEDAASLKEFEQTAGKVAATIDHLEFQSMMSEPVDINNCYVHIHPGAGGTESCDWGSMLYRMYLRWCERSGYEVSVIDQTPGAEAGIDAVTFQVKGDYAYGYLKAETGVHRLVRISPFDSNARRHTSFCSVFASPEVDDSIDIEIVESDLRIDRFRAGGAGGQHVNRTESAVRLTHIPTNIVVQCQNERSQHQNMEVAMKILKGRLYQRELERRQAEAAAADERKDIAWGSQIRSYVLHPYNMVKDHRTEEETSNTQAVLDGDLDRFMEAYLKWSAGSRRKDIKK
ncbi:MAG: peptide chain release factor 2 [Candidatus Sumerlaeota bacterium]|nr:peptide chain release factor 2 [Candidatus Sumerlaeota bacterium]